MNLRRKIMITEGNQKCMDYSKVTFDPYEILEIANEEQSQLAFYTKINIKDMHSRIMVTLSRDYFQTKDQKRYKIIEKNKIQLQLYGLYEAALTSNLNYLKQCITKNNKNVICQHGRSLLYTCARSGYYDCTLYLLQIGCDINPEEVHGSTCLHAAAYYGHRQIVKLLLSYGSQPNLKNKYQNTPIQESRNQEIAQLISESQQDNIQLFIQQQLLKGQNKQYCQVEIGNNKSLIKIHKFYDQQQLNFQVYKDNQYDQCFHGTKFRFLCSIFENGLKPAGSKIGGNTIQTLAGHIDAATTFEGIENWGKAIFVSPSPFYAADVAYSERIVSQGQQYCCLIEAKVKKGCYTQHSSTAFQQQQQGSSEPVNIEYRVAEDSEVKIYRIAKEEYLKICSIMFVSVKLLESGNYEEIVNLINHTTII